MGMQSMHICCWVRVLLLWWLSASKSCCCLGFPQILEQPFRCCWCQLPHHLHVPRWPSPTRISQQPLTLQDQSGRQRNIIGRSRRDSSTSNAATASRWRTAGRSRLRRQKYLPSWRVDNRAETVLLGTTQIPSDKEDDDNVAESLLDVSAHSNHQRQAIALLIDRALSILSVRRPHSQKTTWTWMEHQLDSLIHHLSARMTQQSRSVVVVESPPLPSSSVSPTKPSGLSRQDAAVAIEQALLQRASSAQIEALILAFRQTTTSTTEIATISSTLAIQQKQQQQQLVATVSPEVLERELQTIQQQLDAFEALILSVLEQDRTSSLSVPATSNPLIDSPLAEPSIETVMEQLEVEHPSSAADSTEHHANNLPQGMFESNNSFEADDEMDDKLQDIDEEVDVAIIGAGLGGLCAGAILNTVYGKKVGIYESHDRPGGCAHSFTRRANNGVTFTMESGPTILLGCSSKPYNALRQVLDAVGHRSSSSSSIGGVEWIRYSGWGVIENPGKNTERRWRVQLGPDAFPNGPLLDFGGPLAVQEFRALQTATHPLTVGSSIPAMAMRSGPTAVVPLLLRYFPTLMELIQQGDALSGTFAPFMDGPLFKVTSPWLRNWLDALAFSLSGLPASRTAAAAMAFVLHDMHRQGAALDYPKGGMGDIVNALVRGVEQGGNGSKVHLRQHVSSIDCNKDATKVTGVTLQKGDKRIRARVGVICNAPVWSLRGLVKDERMKRALSMCLPLPDQQLPLTSWTTTNDGSSMNLVRDTTQMIKQNESLLSKCVLSEMTASFMHLHLAIDAKGLNLDEMEAHYTVMDRSLAGDGTIVNGVVDGPCAIGNMIAVSNPCVIDRTLAPKGYIVVHAYGAANEPYELWQSLGRTSPEYTALKKKRAEPLWRAVESIIPDVRQRVVMELIGSPQTHERYLRRPRGTYGSATEDYLKDGSTPYKNLMLASDGVFPGIGVPAVAIAGASAANSLVDVFHHWRCLDTLKRHGQVE